MVEGGQSGLFTSPERYENLKDTLQSAAGAKTLNLEFADATRASLPTTVQMWDDLGFECAFIDECAFATKNGSKSELKVLLKQLNKVHNQDLSIVILLQDMQEADTRYYRKLANKYRVRLIKLKTTSFATVQESSEGASESFEDSKIIILQELNKEIAEVEQRKAVAEKRLQAVEEQISELKAQKEASEKEAAEPKVISKEKTKGDEADNATSDISDDITGDSDDDMLPDDVLAAMAKAEAQDDESVSIACDLAELDRLEQEQFEEQARQEQAESKVREEELEAKQAQAKADKAEAEALKAEAAELAAKAASAPAVLQNVAVIPPEYFAPIAPPSVKLRLYWKITEFAARVLWVVFGVGIATLVVNMAVNEEFRKGVLEWLMNI